MFIYFADWMSYMNKKSKMFLLSFVLFESLLLNARYVRHASVFLQEEIVSGIEFSSSIKSDRGKVEELYFVNKIPVQKDDFYKELEVAQLLEIRREHERIERQKKNRIMFADQAQVAIIEKMIKKRLQESLRVLDLVQNEQLQPYFVFQRETIDSLQKLLDMKQFANSVPRGELKELVEDHDMRGLQEMLDTIEQWPDRLELFFQASVQNAIKNSDDTAMLKELLGMLSQ